MSEEDSSHNLETRNPTTQNDRLDKNETDTAASTTTTTTSSLPRSIVGQASVDFSDWVNENLVAARFASLTTIGLLTAYGISQTPLFFRYRTVADIPSTLFRARVTLRGRLMHCPTTAAGQPLRCRLRHLSPLESWLPKPTWQALLRFYPAIRPADHARETLLVEVAGLQSTEYYQSVTDPPGAWWERLARDRTAVSVQLLGRRVIAQNHKNNTTTSDRPTKRQIPGLSSPDSLHDESAEHIAIARLYYRPKPTQLWATDLAHHMVRAGRANVASDGLYGTASSSHADRPLDTTDSVAALQADVTYVQRLAQAEYEAAAESRGQWADPAIRQAQPEVVAEGEFQSKASVWQKLWRHVRGG